MHNRRATNAFGPNSIAKSIRCTNKSVYEGGGYGDTDGTPGVIIVNSADESKEDTRRFMIQNKTATTEMFS